MSDASARTVVRDRTELIGGALVHHGPMSDRAYLVKPGPDPAADVAVLERLAREFCYGKLFAKVPADAFETYAAAGFIAEARVPLSGPGSELVFCSRFTDPARADDVNKAAVSHVLARCTDVDGHLTAGRSGSQKRMMASTESGVSVRLADMRDVESLADLYAEVFESYPFDIDSPGFLRSAMSQGTVFAVALDRNRIVAAASAELDDCNSSGEMTDFATRSDYRGTGLASTLLQVLESEALSRRVSTAYTIARATSTSMNRVFATGGYSYGGTLINNTGICGGLESMNVWYRALAA